MYLRILRLLASFVKIRFKKYADISKVFNPRKKKKQKTNKFLKLKNLH